MVLRCRLAVTPIVRDAAPETIAVLQRLVEFFESMPVTQTDHAAGELAPVRPARVADYYLDIVAGMTIDKSRNQVGVIGLVKDIAADHDVEFAQPGIRLVPVTGNRNHYGMMKPGGVRRDVSTADIPAIREMLGALDKPLNLFRNLFYL